MSRRLKLYHATKQGGATSILRDGFSLPDVSQEWHLGRGAYFHTSPAAVCRLYGPDLVAVEVDAKLLKPKCRVDHGTALYTFGHYLEDLPAKERRAHTRRQHLLHYLGEAHTYAQAMLDAGCPVVWQDQGKGKQVVLYDERLLKRLKAVKATCPAPKRG